MSEARFTYSDLIDYSAERMELPRSEVHRRLRLLMEIVQQGLVRDGLTSIPGLGVFKLKWQPERTGRNPMTGEIMIIPGHQRILFKPEASLRKFINRKYEKLSYTEIPEKRESKEPLVVPSSLGTMGEDHASHEKEVRYIPPPRRFKLRWLIGLVVLVLLVWLIISLCHPKSETSPPPKSVSNESALPASKPITESKPEEVEHETPPPKQTALTFPESSCVVRAGDRLWDISSAHYHSAYYWPVIYQANRSQIRHPDALIPGLRLNLPALECPNSRLSGNDKRKLADGYLSVYRIYEQIGKSDAYHYLWTAHGLNPNMDLSQIQSADLKKIHGMQGRMQIR